MSYHDTHVCTSPCRESANVGPCKIQDPTMVGAKFAMICNLGYRTHFRPLKGGE